MSHAPKNVKYTQIAAKQLSLAELFGGSFAAGLQGPVHHKVELSAPDGPSTAGGKLAVQHIKLIPVNGPTIVIGSTNTEKQTVELRTFEHVEALHARRFRGARVPLDVKKYRELTQRLMHFFASMRMTVTFEDATILESIPPPTGAEPQGNAIALVVMGIIAAVATAAAIFFALKR